MSVIETQNLTFTYCSGNAYEHRALNNITFSIEKGVVFGIFGENGSGKSTLIKHFNGILEPTEGDIKVFGKTTKDKNYRNDLWRKVGIVFQFPEQQIFEDTVFNEIAYGLKNLKVSKEEIPIRVKKALEMVGLNNEDIEELSPLCLSGGIRRRVAIASVLVMEPDIVILDECTAGLDLPGREKILNIINKIKENKSTTIIIISHDLNELISVCTHLAVLKEGEMISFGRTVDVLNDSIVKQNYIEMFPDYIQLLHNLSDYYEEINTHCISLEEIELELHKILTRGCKYEKY